MIHPAVRRRIGNPTIRGASGRTRLFFTILQETVNLSIYGRVLMTNYDKDTKVMDRKEKHVMESGSVAQRETRQAFRRRPIAESLPANGRRRKRERRAQDQPPMAPLGVLTLIFILLYWLFSIGIFEDLIGYFNG